MSDLAERADNFGVLEVMFEAWRGDIDSEPVSLMVALESALISTYQDGL